MKSSTTTKKYFKDGKLITGFTIIEIVIAISLLSFALVGIFSAYSVVVISTADTANQLTANYLGQEGMEIVRNIRDENWMHMDYCSFTNLTDPSCTPAPMWLDGLTSSGTPAVNCLTGCEVDYTTGTSASPNWSMKIYAGLPLKIDSSGLYNYTNGTATKFKRKITITPVTDVTLPANIVGVNPSDHIVMVKVQVSWDKKATILNPSKISADPTGCNPANCVTTEETLYNWYNYISQ